MLSKDLERIEREQTMRQDADWQRQLKEAAEAPATMHGRAAAEASINTGRFTQVNAAHVVGSEPAVKYPAASSSWQIQLPDEPPLGPDNPALEPAVALPASPAAETGGAVSAPSPTSGVERPAPSLFSNQTTDEPSNG
jgi:hypothetical protein